VIVHKLTVIETPGFVCQVVFIPVEVRYIFRRFFRRLPFSSARKTVGLPICHSLPGVVTEVMKSYWDELSWIFSYQPEPEKRYFEF